MADHNVAKLGNPKGYLAMIISIWTINLGNMLRYTDAEIQIQRCKNTTTNTQMQEYKLTDADIRIQIHNKGTSLFQVVSPFKAKTRKVQAHPDLKVEVRNAGIGEIDEIGKIH